ncbi:MAG TPA: hypothetical protein VLK56_03445 [Solirubrobacterales bacterium]|nr:hypothetical protein [Solirubrobacterales bacterium]
MSFACEALAAAERLLALSAIGDHFSLDIGGRGRNAEYSLDQLQPPLLRPSGAADLGDGLFHRVLDLPELHWEFSMQSTPADEKNYADGREQGYRALQVEQQPPAQSRSGEMAGNPMGAAGKDDTHEDDRRNRYTPAMLLYPRLHVVKIRRRRICPFRRRRFG